MISTNPYPKVFLYNAKYEIVCDDRSWPTAWGQGQHITSRSSKPSPFLFDFRRRSNSLVQLKKLVIYNVHISMVCTMRSSIASFTGSKSFSSHFGCASRAINSSYCWQLSLRGWDCSGHCVFLMVRERQIPGQFLGWWYTCSCCRTPVFPTPSSLLVCVYILAAKYQSEGIGRWGRASRVLIA